jgi:hypothetical protein
MAIVALAPDAASAIECRGGFQVVDGREISTPYCRDTHLAKVAGVSADKVRNNPNFKEEVCRHYGYDNRVREACNTYDSDPGGK